MTMHELVNDKSATLIDVRSEGEFASGNVDGSINIPLNEIPSRVDEFKKYAANGPVVVFCLSGGRAGQAEMFLKQSGIENVYNAGAWAQVKIHRMANA